MNEPKRQKKLSKQESINRLFPKQFLDEIALLSYEQALRKFDDMLDELQEDKVVIEDLQKHYLEAKLYLNHCKQLLFKLEQEVIQIDE